MKAIVGFFQFLILAALIAAVLYNTYTIQQLQEQLAQLQRTKIATSSAKSASSRVAPTHLPERIPEPGAVDPRHRNWDNARQEATEAFTALQKANNDAQIASRRTVSDLQRRIGDLTTQVESLKRQASAMAPHTGNQ